MIKIIPLLIAVTATAISSSDGTRGGGAMSRPSRSDGPITISSSVPYESGFTKSKFTPPIVVSFPTGDSTSSSLTSSVSSNEPANQHLDYFYCDRYGPFTLDGPREVEMTFTYELHSIETQNIIERVRLFKGGHVVAATSKASFNYVKGNRKSVTFSPPIGNYLSDSGIELRFEIVDTSYRVLKFYFANIYPPSKERVLATSLKQGIYTSKPVAFYGNGKDMVEIVDEFDFTKIGDYVDNDYYYRLDIGRNAFYFQNNYQITCSSANLRFYDDDYLFPNFTHQSNDEIVIPLKIYQRNEKLCFQFVNKFYVEKKTLDVSDTYQPNYIISSSFYLPINGLRKFNGKTLYVDINGLGMNEISTTIPLKYELNRLIMGSCSDGEYCIHGGTA